VTVPTRNLNRNTVKKDYKLFRKMLFQIGICVCIYFSVYFIQYSNYYFSSDVMKKIEGLLSYDINFNEKFNQFNEYMKNNNFFSGIFSYGVQSEDDEENDIASSTADFINNNEQNVEDDGNPNSIQSTQSDSQNNDGNLIENKTVSENINEVNFNSEKNNNENVIKENNVENKEGAEKDTEGENSKEENVDKVGNANEDNNQSSDKDVVFGTGGGEGEKVDSDEEQMKKDAKTIKDNFNITLPLRGTITSRFGDREIEPKFHTGIDIARNKGSEIISATNGTVILAEEQSSYGKIIKIQNNNLVVLYAHCNELLVKVGDKVKVMQKIATVGSTGNSTGPHLHFEIMYCGRYVNPEYVIEFKE